MNDATPSPGHLLLVDDEPAFQRLGARWLAGLGHRVSVAGDADAALARFAELRPDVVLLDLAMPPAFTPESGLALIPRFAPAPVIVITGHADHELALAATDQGAWDFIAKPVDPSLLQLVVGRAMQKAHLEQELRRLRAAVWKDAAEDFGIVGHSGPIRQLRELIRRVAPTRLSVVVQGPTGTGKELVARALHTAGLRPQGPMVTLHCGAVPGELLESELFGHLKGSFTGAHRDQPGLLAAADGGTLFLDEVGEMPPAMQVKLLRFLQEGTFLPVGGRETRRADVRVVAATHRELPAMVAAGSFREDLFYRLKGLVLRTPALAERREDIPALAALFLKRAAGRRPARLAPAAGAWLAAQPWPGNVRELQSLIDCACALAPDDGPGGLWLDVETLALAQGTSPVGAVEGRPLSRNQGLDEAIAALEVQMIASALRESGDNRSEAARTLGISRVGLLKKMARLGLAPGSPTAP